MANHRLSRADGEIICVVAEHLTNRQRLRKVAGFSGGAVSVDVADVVRIQARIRQCLLHRRRGASPIFRRGSHMVGIAAHAKATEFAINPRAPGASTVKRFQH